LILIIVMQIETSQLGIFHHQNFSANPLLLRSGMTYVTNWHGFFFHFLRLIKIQNDLSGQILVLLWPGVLSHWRVRFYNISNIDPRELNVGN